LFVCNGDALVDAVGVEPVIRVLYAGRVQRGRAERVQPGSEGTRRAGSAGFRGDAAVGSAGFGGDAQSGFSREWVIGGSDRRRISMGSRVGSQAGRTPGGEVRQDRESRRGRVRRAGRQRTSVKTSGETLGKARHQSGKVHLGVLRGVVFVGRMTGETSAFWPDVRSRSLNSVGDVGVRGRMPCVGDGDLRDSLSAVGEGVLRSRSLGVLPPIGAADEGVSAPLGLYGLSEWSAFTGPLPCGLDMVLGRDAR
jgi:hypothetical protein